MDLNSLLNQKIDYLLKSKDTILNQLTNEDNDDPSTVISRQNSCNLKNQSNLNILLVNPDFSFTICTEDDCKKENINNLYNSLKTIDEEINQITLLLNRDVNALISINRSKVMNVVNEDKKI